MHENMRKSVYSISSLRSLKPIEMAQLGKKVLKATQKLMTSVEIIEEVIIRKHGKNWAMTAEKNAYLHAKRASQMLSQILGTKPHAEEVRADLGIGLLRKKNGKLVKPLKFYLLEYASFVEDEDLENPPQKPQRKNPITVEGRTCKAAKRQRMKPTN